MNRRYDTRGREKPTLAARFRAFLVFFAMLAVLAFVIVRVVFVVRTIEIVGVDDAYKQTVFENSGVWQGQTIFSVDKDTVEKNIHEKTLLRFENMVITFPNKVTLQVAERKQAALIEHLGFLYTMDETGRILSQSADLDENVTIPIVKGMNPQRIEQGKMMECNNLLQVPTLSLVLEAISTAAMTDQIEEVSLSDLSNIALLTRSGVKIELGDREGLGTKLAIAQAILRDRQFDESIFGAKIDVASGHDGYYLPPQ